MRQQGMYMRDMRQRVPHHRRRRRASSRHPKDTRPHLSYDTRPGSFPEHLAMLLLDNVVIPDNHNVIWWDPDDWGATDPAGQIWWSPVGSRSFPGVR